MKSIPLPSAWKKGGLSYRSGFSLSTAKDMLEAAEKEAENQGVPMSLAIVDNGGNLFVFHRMEEAMLASIEIAMDKAFTAVFGKLPSQSWRDRYEEAGVQPPSFIHKRWIALSGGFPLVKDGTLLGGIGVSGGNGRMDTLVARAALQAGGFSYADADAALSKKKVAKQN